VPATRKADLLAILQAAGASGANATAQRLMSDAAAMMADGLASEAQRNDAQLTLYVLLGDPMRYAIMATQGVQPSALRKAYVAARLAAVPTSESYIEQALIDYKLSHEFPVAWFRLQGTDNGLDKVPALAQAYANLCFSTAQ
jgi:hypothetical protein